MPPPSASQHSAFQAPKVCSSAHPNVRRVLCGRLALWRQQRENVLKTLTDTLQLGGWDTGGKWQHVLRALLLDLALESFASAGDGEPLIVEKLLDAQHVLDVALTIHALPGGTLDRLELREFTFPETQHVSRQAAQLGDFTDTEVQLLRYERLFEFH